MKKAAVGEDKPKKAPKVKPEPHPLEPQIGKLVQYYDNGWRYGYLEGIVKHATHIRPIAGKGKVVRNVTIPDIDVKEILNAPSTS